MKFTVRYWSSLLPDEYRKKDGSHCWQDYSIHPASKIGLHSAMLAVHDRCEILQAHGGQFECALFASTDGGHEKLSPEAANRLFSSLPDGEVKWLDIRACLLPGRFARRASDRPAENLAQVEQLPLFAHTHTGYDDLEQAPSHAIDIDI